MARPEHVRVLCELLKLPLDQLLAFQATFCGLGQLPLLRLTRLLGARSC